jgi:23S rRNA (uracil1939-C5)-methyltransferase
LSTNPDSFRVTPERFVAGGEALAHDDRGRVLFVRGGIPGDELEVETIEQKGAWSRVKVENVIVASEQRVRPPCSQRVSGCGGCDWQHIDARAQLPYKVEIVSDALRRTAKMTAPEVRQGASVPPVGYRTTVRVVGDSAGRAAFRRERSHETVDAVPCLVAHPYLQPVLAEMRIKPGVEVSLRTSVATGEVTAWWPGDRELVRGLSGPVSTGPEAFVTEEVAGHEFRVSSRSFFQSGPAAAALLVDAVKRAAPELEAADLVVDAYAGVGMFAVAATRPDSRVLTIESSKFAVADSRVNLAGRRAEVHRGDVANWRASNGAVDVIIADPSRQGLGRPAVEALAAARAPIITLVSCDPVSLARDTSLFLEAGYRHERTEVLDLFPHTHHIECVTRFTLGT